MADRLRWEVDGRNWPNREASRFVAAHGVRWHVQVFGQGPVALLLHGTGAATHSWRDLAPALAARFKVVAPDLPGHGFTGPVRISAMSLPGMAQAVRHLLRELDLQPHIAVGHSAGAAVLARMNLDGLLPVRRIVALNGAFLPFDGIPGHIFSPLAKLFASMPFVPWLFSWRASDRRMVERLIQDTGSRIDAAGIDHYVRLARSPAHVRAALDMMAGWNLRQLERDLPRLPAQLQLIAGGADRTVSPDQSRRVKKIVPGADLVELPGLGHLAHEESPAAIASPILALAEPAPAHTSMS